MNCPVCKKPFRHTQGTPKICPRCGIVLKQGTAAMIDPYDIRLFTLWLQLARTRGTNVVKVKVAAQPNTWTVWCDETKGEQP